MQIENLSWFPGHMTKTKRMISAEIKNMDAVCEIVDARIPLSSRNPDVDELTAGKPRLIVLNRADQADPVQTRRWTQYFRGQGFAVLEANAKNGVGTEKFSAAVRELLRDKLAAAAAKGQVGKVVRVMVLGVPNVGKSTFINKVAHRKTARAEADWLCSDYLNENDRVFFVSQGDNGEHWFSAVFDFYPVLVDYSGVGATQEGGGGTFGLPELEPQEEGVKQRYYHPYTAERLDETVRANGCTVLYLQKIDDIFVQSYQNLFTDHLAAAQAGQTLLYRVTDAGYEPVTMQMSKEAAQ